MGAWGASPFENDDASDWLIELEEADDLLPVRTALAAAAGDNDYLDLQYGAPAVAAAEVVAAVAGLPATSLPKSLELWLRVHGLEVGKSDVALALAALDVVESDRSELAGLWLEAGPAEWKAHIADLRARLERLASVPVQSILAAPADDSPTVTESTPVAVTEGSCHAVPLDDGGFGSAVVARVGTRERIFLAYLFGPRSDDKPDVGTLDNAQPELAVMVAIVEGDKLEEAGWLPLGPLPGWDRRRWPIPAFGRYLEEEPALRDLRLEYVDDDLDRPPVGSWIPSSEARRLPKETRLSALGVRYRLTRLLGAPPD